MFTAQTTGEFWTIARTAMAKVATVTLFLPLAWGQVPPTPATPSSSFVYAPFVVRLPFITAELKVNNPGNVPALNVNCGYNHSQFGLQGNAVGTIGVRQSVELFVTAPKGAVQFYCTGSQPLIANVYIQPSGSASTQPFVFSSGQGCTFSGLTPQILFNGAVPAPATTAPLAFTLSVGAVRPAGSLTVYAYNPFNKSLGVTWSTTSDGGVTTPQISQTAPPGGSATSTFSITDQDAAVSATTTLPTPFLNVTTGDGTQFMMRDFHLILIGPSVPSVGFIGSPEFQSCWNY